jgi:putrescine transport system substrate-binding protein
LVWWDWVSTRFSRRQERVVTPCRAGERVRSRGVVRQFSFPVLAMLLTVTCGSARAEEQVLNIYNWSDYIAPNTIGDFEKATGIKVNYDTYDSNETLEAKLAAGNSGYDLVGPSLTPFLARQIKGGFYQTLDKSKLPNETHLNKDLLARMAVFDKDNAHAIPWLSGTTGIGYNAELVKKLMPDAPVTSLKMIFDPEVVAKFKECGIVLLDSPTEVFPAALNYLGLNPDSQKPEDLQKAADLLMKIRPFIRKYDSSEYINDLANGDICLAWGYSSDINLARRRAREAGKGVSVVFAIPKEGTQRYIDTLAMPKDAPHPDAAYKFLNYIMDPKVIADTVNAIYVESGNGDAGPYIKPEITADAGIFPSAETEKTIFQVAPSTPEIDRLRTRLWTKVKTGR